MLFSLKFSTEAKETITYLEQNQPKKYRKVIKTLALNGNKFTSSKFKYP